MRPSPRLRALSLAVGLSVAMSGCDAPATSPATAPPATASRSVAATSTSLAALGKQIFEDQQLSLNRNQSCASCHTAAWGFTSPNPKINAAGAVMFGSVPTRFGNRKPPSAAYATQSPILSYDAVAGTYVGGNFWDGRATGHRLGSPSAEQSQGPFVNTVEQALPDVACVIYRIGHGNYSSLYTSVYGNSIRTIAFPEDTDDQCEHENRTIPLTAAARSQVMVEYDRMAMAIAGFEGSPEVNQFSSKYDAYLAGKATLGPLEQRGLVLYSGKANCAACHPNAGAEALFTDYTYDNIGVPANPQNPALRADPTFRDLGVGGFFGKPEHYGREKVPTLRNLDKRGIPGGAKSYMHNGAFKSIAEVVHFYNTRDVLPDCKVVHRPVSGVNCWPAPEVKENVNLRELGNLGLTAAEEVALVAYLKTLSDGYTTR
jgi:cytochrome c peroxidase